MQPSISFHLPWTRLCLRPGGKEPLAAECRSTCPGPSLAAPATRQQVMLLEGRKEQEGGDWRRWWDRRSWVQSQEGRWGAGRGRGARSGYISSPPQARVPYLRRDQDYLLLGAVDWNKVLPVLTRETSVPSMLGDSNRPRREGAVPLKHLPRSTEPSHALPKESSELAENGCQAPGQEIGREDSYLGCWGWLPGS